MTLSPIAARRFAAVLASTAVLACAAGLPAGCGTSAAPSARPTVTITVTGTPASSPAASPAPVPPSQSSPPSGPPGCTTAGLTAAIGPGNAAAGSSYYPIRFTNKGASACSLYGYPGVSFISAAGQQIGAAATEDPTFPRRVVTLAAGATAHAEIRVADAQNFPASDCHPVAVHRLRIYPPGQTAALNIGLTSMGCTSTKAQILGVQTVQPGSTGQ
jgi:Protein of unknown function (DUF4232)